MNKNELMPCPFCGEEAKIEQVERINYGIVYRVGCRTEGCIGWWYESVLYYTEATAFTAWNRRVKRYPESLAQRMIADSYEYELFELRKECDRLQAQVDKLSIECDEIKPEMRREERK